jgi:hypothetical protein
MPSRCHKPDSEDSHPDDEEGIIVREFSLSVISANPSRIAPEPTEPVTRDHSGSNVQGQDTAVSQGRTRAALAG